MPDCHLQVAHFIDHYVFNLTILAVDFGWVQAHDGQEHIHGCDACLEIVVVSQVQDFLDQVLGYLDIASNQLVAYGFDSLRFDLPVRLDIQFDYKLLQDTGLPMRYFNLLHVIILHLLAVLLPGAFAPGLQGDA